MKILNLRSLMAAAILAGISSLGFNSAAHAVTVDFAAIPADGALAGADQINLDITDLGTAAQFNWTMSAGVNPDMNIAEIYIDDRTPIFLAPINITTQIGTDFTPGDANPGNLPGGNTLPDPFTVTTDLLADAQGRSTNGLTIGDNLIFNISYALGANFTDLLDALNNGSLRVGVHARSLLGGESEGYVSQPPSPIPVPAAGLLLLGSLGGLAVIRRRKKS